MALVLDSFVGGMLLAMCQSAGFLHVAGRGLGERGELIGGLGYEVLGVQFV